MNELCADLILSGTGKDKLKADQAMFSANQL